MDPSSYTYPQKLPDPSWRSPRRPSTRGSHQAPRLGAISEDSSTVSPDLPPRAHNRPFQRMFHLGFPPLYSTHGERMPPEYSTVDENYNTVKGPKGENFQDLRGNRHITKRGGWRRLGLLGGLAVIVVIALGAGLGAGLASRKKNDSSNPSNSPSQNQSFPLGAYSFPTFLSTVTTSCTRLSSTWSCYPYQTYEQSPTGALTTFTWIITSPSSSSSSSSSKSDPTNPLSPTTDYLISSTPNPFALTFTNTTLRLTDAGLESEALIFSVPMQKTVIPNEDISGGDGSAAKCLYDETVFEGRVYTRRSKTYPPTPSDATSDGGRGGGGGSEFEPWLYAVEIAQTISMAPECYKTLNGDLRDRIDLDAPAAGAGGECECGYRNFGT